MLCLRFQNGLAAPEIDVSQREVFSLIQSASCDEQVLKRFSGYLYFYFRGNAALIHQPK